MTQEIHTIKKRLQFFQFKVSTIMGITVLKKCKYYVNSKQDRFNQYQNKI